MATQELENELFEDDGDRVLLIDPMALKLAQGLPDNHFSSRSNDSRKNTTKWSLNCGFRTVSINGWPGVFLETTKDVKKGQELFSDYGKTYWRAN